MKTVACLLVGILALAGCRLGAKSPTIKDGSSVKFNYVLHVDGAVVDSSGSRGPLAFVEGQHGIVPGLEEAMLGLKVGDKKTITVSPEKGYGPPNPDAIRKAPKTAFSQPNDLKPGDMVRGNAGGRPFAARVVSVDADSIHLDMNHPLAGKTLVFDITVTEVLEPGAKPAAATKG